MDHSIEIKYKIKYVWIGIAFILLSGSILFYCLYDNNINFGVLEIIAYLTGMTATLTLIYHSFTLEYQINTQKKNSQLFRAKYTYDIISEWSKPKMRIGVNEVRELLKDPEREKELLDPSKIQDFANFLAENKKKRSYLVMTLNYFENISTMIETDHIDKDIIKKAFKSLFVSYYLVLRNYIDYRQKEYPDSWMYYEKISKQWIEDNKLT